MPTETCSLVEMMKELHRSFPLEITIPNFNCTVHEDNQSCISMANRQKFSKNKAYPCAFFAC
eukprot:scaffold13316_cov39-Skeletonema_dohrnii-CCMP3373.AAC.1